MGAPALLANIRLGCKRLARNKHSSLLGTLVNYGCKKFYIIGLRSLVEKDITTLVINTQGWSSFINIDFIFKNFNRYLQKLLTCFVWFLSWIFVVKIQLKNLTKLVGSFCEYRLKFLKMKSTLIRDVLFPITLMSKGVFLWSLNYKTFNCVSHRCAIS